MEQPGIGKNIIGFFTGDMGWQRWASPLVLACIMVVTSFQNFLLFHTLAELFAVVIGILMAVVAWNTYDFSRNNFLMYLGCGYFWIAVIDLYHALAYKGMNILPVASADPPTQLWIVARYLEALLLITAPIFLTRKVARLPIFISFGVIAAISYTAIMSGYFPACFIEGEGLTKFKIISEYVIILILVGTIIILHRKRSLIEPKIFRLMVLAIFFTISAELAFTFYVSVYGLSNMIGHIAKLFSFWLIYQAIIQTTLKEPFAVMAREASTYNAIPDPAIVVDKYGIIHQVNDAACEFTNMPEEEIVGKHCHPLFHPAPDDPEQECGLCQKIGAGTTLTASELEFTETGTWRRFSLSPINMKDVVSGMVQVCSDVTQQKKTEQDLRSSEARLNTLVEAIPELVWLKNTDGTYLYCNRIFERYVGVKEKHIIGRTDYDLLDSKLAAKYRQKDILSMSTDNPIYDENWGKFPDTGQKVLFESVITPTHDSDGNIIGILGIARDITQRRYTETALRRSQKMEAIGQITGGIAHDFNNILSIIIGNLDLLTHTTFANEQDSKRVETAAKAAMRAVDLTRQLLGFSRDKGDKKTRVNINDVIMGMNKLLAKSFTPQIEEEYHLSNDICLADIDTGDFENALLNLSINARDAMPNGGTLTIETKNIVLDDSYIATEPLVTPGNYILVAISDTGSGIPKEDLERVLEPFFTTKPRDKGTGLGLSMVFGFVKRTNGHMKIYSELGIGTTVRLYLPCASGEGQEITPAGVYPTELPKGSETILMVDDEKDMLELGKAYLNDLGYTTLIASNGEEALKRLESNRGIALLFSDVVMPGGINGYELAEQALDRYPGLKVLLVSGFTERASNTNHKRLQKNILDKPYNKTDLARAIRRLLDEKQDEQ